MAKLYTNYVLLTLFIFCVEKVFAQKPVLSLSATTNLTVNTSIAPLRATNTGGAVPNLLYSKVTGVAGNGLYGSKDSTAFTSSFQNPTSVAYDKAGNMYIADGNLNQIRKLSVSTGLITVFAGSVNGASGKVDGQDTSARFYNPTSIAIDSLGNMFVADFQNNLIRVISPGGAVKTIAGTGSGLTYISGNGSTTLFNLPHAIVLDKLGHLIVADTYNSLIRKITFTYNGTTPANVQTSIVAGRQFVIGTQNGLPTAATFNAPYSVAVDASNNIYVAEFGGRDVRKIRPDSVVTVWTGSIKDSLVSIAIDKANNLFVASYYNYHITKIPQDGSSSIPDYPYFSGGSVAGNTNSTDTLSRYRGFMNLFVNGQNSLIITDPGNELIKKANVTGYEVYPRLPAGLSIDNTGTITGTPIAIQSATTYNIIAHNASGTGYASTSITVGLGARTMTLNPLAAKTYGDAMFSPNAVSTDTGDVITYASSNPAVAIIVSDSVKIVGAGTTVITASQAPSPNYSTAPSASQTLTVNPATITITANDAIKTQGTPNPAFTAVYAGFVNGETSGVITTLPALQTTAVDSSPAGSYPITPSGAVASNYNFNYVTGNLTVFPIPVITVSGNSNIAVGDSVLLVASPSSGYTYQWQMSGPNILGATGNTYYAKQTGDYTVSITGANSYTTYSVGVPITTQLVLTASNFTLRINSVTCKGSNNGVIHIAAIQKLNYTATLSGNNLNNTYSFTDSLAIGSLPPGSYSICLAVVGQIFSQCYQVNVTEPKDLSVYTAVNKNTNSLDLQLDGGNTYNITLNNNSYTTSNSQVSIPLTAGINKLTITTDKICQGYIEKTIDVSDNLMPYPNPFSSLLNVNIGNQNVGNVAVDVVGMPDGKSVYKSQYTNQSGVLQLDLSNLKSGFYYINLTLDNSKSGFKIIKR